MTASFGDRTWYYTLDTELRLIHAFRHCRAVKMAGKYGYAKEFRLSERNHEQADQLDRLLTEENYRICHNCWKIEQGLSKKDHRGPRPGFKREPRK